LQGFTDRRVDWGPIYGYCSDQQKKAPGLNVLQTETQKRTEGTTSHAHAYNVYEEGCNIVSQRRQWSDCAK